jgi:predicted nucleotidyltransferase
MNMDIEKIKPEIIERLKPLNPDKIILFGSYAYGEPNKDSDIDLFIIKNDLTQDKIRDFELKVRKRLRDIIFKYDTNGIDVLSAPLSYIENREDYFFKVDILKRGKVWYERDIS